MKIHLLTSDGYDWAVLPYSFLLKKYWPDHPPVVVGGFTPPAFPMPSGFSFVSIGDFNEYPVTKWSDALIRFLNLVDDDIVLFMLEDMWMVREVNDHAVRMAYDYMRQFKYVARLDLTGDRLNSRGPNGEWPSLYGKLGEYDLVQSNPDWQYHLSTMPAFWRKEHLLRVLVPGETPWQVELDGTPRLSALRREMIVLGTTCWPIRNTLAFRGGDSATLLLNEVKDEDVAEMNRLRLFDRME